MSEQDMTKKTIKNGSLQTAAGAFASSNDMDDSFFTYLKELKHMENTPQEDRDDLINLTDNAMDDLREKIFALAPAAENLNSILASLESNAKSVDDIFFASSLKKNDCTDEKFFAAWRKKISSLLSELEQNYQSSAGETTRAALIAECGNVKVNFDYLDMFFNHICNYIALHSEKDCVNNDDYKQLIKTYNPKQLELLAGKFMFPKEHLIRHIQELFEANQRLIELKHEILRNHLRLVISVAQKFRNRGVAFNDIVQEGNLGLMRAIDKFDPHLGHQFSTYAVWWIKQNIIHSIAEQSRTIRIPAHMLNLINKINQTEQQLVQNLGREPESEEIAEVLGLSTAKINAVRCMARQTISLQSPVGSQDENFSLEDTLKDTADNKDFTNFDKDVTYKILYQLIRTLSPREQEIITLRFGLFGNKPTPFTELSERYGLTRERVRQLELKILNKLRTPEKLKLLDYSSSPQK